MGAWPSGLHPVCFTVDYQTARRKLLKLDQTWSRRLSIAERPGPLRDLAILFSHSGDSWFWAAGLALLWLLGDSDWKARDVILAAGVFITALTVLIIKFSVRRQRPAGEWGRIYRSTDPHSFPSGHAARAVMLGVVAIGIGPAWFGWILAIWAPLVILSRVAMGVHYLSDVIAGALLGAALGAGVLFFFA